MLSCFAVAFRRKSKFLRAAHTAAAQDVDPPNQTVAAATTTAS